MSAVAVGGVAKTSAFVSDMRAFLKSVSDEPVLFEGTDVIKATMFTGAIGSHPFVDTLSEMSMRHGMHLLRIEVVAPTAVPVPAPGVVPPNQRSAPHFVIYWGPQAELNREQLVRATRNVAIAKPLPWVPSPTGSPVYDSRVVFLREAIAAVVRDWHGEHKGDEWADDGTYRFIIAHGRRIVLHSLTDPSVFDATLSSSPTVRLLISLVDTERGREARCIFTTGNA
jgi:hypothetical protein